MPELSQCPGLVIDGLVNAVGALGIAPAVDIMEDSHDLLGPALYLFFQGPGLFAFFQGPGLFAAARTTAPIHPIHHCAAQRIINSSH